MSQWDSARPLAGTIPVPSTPEMPVNSGFRTKKMASLLAPLASLISTSTRTLSRLLSVMLLEMTSFASKATRSRVTSCRISMDTWAQAASARVATLAWQQNSAPITIEMNSRFIVSPR